MPTANSVLRRGPSWLLCVYAILVPCIATIVDPLSTLNANATLNSRRVLAANLKDGKSCTPRTVIYRREWSQLTKRERREYIAAVQCLIQKPSSADPLFAPGARSRFDDFSSVHINQTLSIHGTGNFLSWHRYFIWSYEQALRNECGYSGYQPYWDFGLWANDPEKSPIFDGSDTSMSGNGEYIEHGGHAIGGGQIIAPAGNGGGCVNSGPFKNMTIHLGPVSPSINFSIPANPQANGLGYNPRCLRRDISPWFSTQWNKNSDIADLISNYTTIGPFQDRMQGDFPNKFAGVHSGAHYTIWGDPGGDLYASSGDPAFYLLHTMIDKIWWVWQAQDFNTRLQTIAGTITFLNRPPSRNQTLDDLIDLGVNAEAKPIKELVDTLDGPFCYIYV